MTDPKRPPIAPPPPPRVPPPPPPPPRRASHRKAPPGATQAMPSKTMPMPPKAGQSASAPTAVKTAPSSCPLSASFKSWTLAEGAGLSPGQPTLAQLIREAYDKGFSDVHVGVGEVPRMRNRGEMELTEHPVTDKPTFMCWLREILTDEEIRRFQNELEFDGAAQYDFARVRINIFDSLTGPAIVMRLIPLKILTMEQLRLPPVLRDVCNYHKGLILVTGPRSSGKSTTLAAMIDYMNKEMQKHIITIEDPIEFVHKNQKSLIQQWEVGVHTLQFNDALKASLQEEPDVIMLGEIRDRETVNTALKAAQTGHLVMGILHTNSAVKTIEQILNFYNSEEQQAIRIALAESMVAIIAQGLCRTTDGKRAAFHDILINTEAIRDYIRKGDFEEINELMAANEFDGMMTIHKSVYNLYQEGRITEETALEMSPQKIEGFVLRGRV